MVDEIKAKATSWVPHEVDENPLANYSVEDIVGLLGSHESEYDRDSWLEGLNIVDSVEEGFQADPSFDARTKWGAWIHPIRD
jgi:GMP synthase-like glutamine amidotransferase